MNIVYVVCMGMCVCVGVCLYTPPPKVDMSHYGSYSFFFFPHFSSIDLKTPTKPKQVFIFGDGDSFSSLPVGV